MIANQIFLSNLSIKKHQFKFKANKNCWMHQFNYWT